MPLPHLRTSVIALALLLGSAGVGHAQQYQAPAPAYGYRVAPRTYYVAPRTTAYRYTYPPTATYQYRSTPFGRYRRAINSGRDPNWAAGRGMRLYKPWMY